MSTDEVLAEALRLSHLERARLAGEVLSSLEEPQEQVVSCPEADTLQARGFQPRELTRQVGQLEMVALRCFVSERRP